MNFKIIRDYYDYVSNLVAKSDLQSELHKITYLPQTKHKGIVSARNLTFNDGGLFRFIEEIQIDGNTLSRIKYSYHFERDAMFFRYDKDPDNVTPFSHAECHLHALAEEPRYITHETNFEEVFNFVLACYYADST